MVPKIYPGPRGLKILLIKNRESLSTTFLVLVKAGTDLEKKQENGIFHFIEHLYFKGTQKYPSAKILLETLDEIGADWNAFTSYQYTGYYLRVLPEYSLKALDILTEILLHPLFPEEEIEKERKVIYEEINLYEDNPSLKIVELGYRLAFGDQPAGWPILGTRETLRNIRREDIFKKVKETYSTKNTLIVISGKILNEKKILAFINERFKEYNFQKPKGKFYFKKPKNIYQEKLEHRNVDQAHIFLGFPFEGKIKLKDKFYDLEILSLILGGKPNSRLWLKIREELGAAYSLKSKVVDFTNRSLFSLRAGLNLDKLENVLKEMVKEINILKREGISEKELEDSKTYLKSHLLLDLEDSFSLANFYGLQYLLGKKLETPKEIENKIEQRKAKDIYSFAQKLFNFHQAKFAIILPERIKINFAKIFKELLI